MRQCECGSYAINLNQNGRDDSHPELCDVCVWKKDAERYRFIRNSTPEQFDQFEPGLYSGGDELDQLTDAAMNRALSMVD